MILIKSGLTLALCVLARGHVKRDLGFSGLGTYHAVNNGYSSAPYSAGEPHQNSVDRQGNAAVPEYTGGLNNFGSAGSPINTANYDNTGNSANQINVNPYSNQIIVPNVGLQYGANHGIPHNNGYGSLNPGLNLAPSNYGGPLPNPVIPVHEQSQSNGHNIIAPMSNIQFPALNPTAMQDFRSASFLPSITSSGISIPHNPTYGQNFLSTGNNQGLYGHGQGVGILPISHGQINFGGFQQNQPAFGHYAPSIPIVQGISHQQVGNAFPSFHGQGINNFPIIPFPVNPPAVGHFNNFPVGDVDTGNVPNEHFGNAHGDTGSTIEVNQENPSTHHDTNDVPNDSYPPQNAQTDEGAYEGHVNSEDDTPTNHHSSDNSNDYQDGYNVHSNENSKGNSYEINHPSYPTSSQEVRGDSVGSYVGSDSSQISQGTSGEQKYGSTGERSSQAHDQPTSKVYSGKARNSKSSSSVTNGHAVGHDENGPKATSFQSFVIHSFKPKRFYPKKNSHKSFEGVHGQGDTFIDIPVEYRKH